MFDFLFYTAALLVTLGVLVTFHEWGHFYAARKLGVKVLRFSVGFGKPLWKRTGKDGVEYVIAGIPLGGYVKMLDEREGNVDSADQSMAFNRQPIWKRNIIVAAGPVANFVLAIIVFWIMFMMGTYVVKPITGEPPAQSIAAEAGITANHRIMAVDGQSVAGWKDVTWALVERLGEAGEIELQLESTETGMQKQAVLNISNWQVDDRRPDVLQSLGLQPQMQLTPVVYNVSSGSAADQAGMQKGDRITQLNDKPVTSFRDISDFMQSVKSTDRISVTVQRDNESLELAAFPQLVDNRYLLGISAYPIVEQQSAGVWKGFQLALDETWRVIALTATMFKKLVLGEVSTKSLGGPISIAEGAGSSARGGLVYFLSFLGMISVNLGLINLLPVPVLDGGHLLFNLMETIKGKPLSEKAQEFGMKIGIVMVLGLMSIAIFNDIARL
ncbi:RIP metalloprotease RseP [Pleionea mediterranea]|uniref:Zinc metalloprotease n=1 Tax=Pleionea mediterranea TaxID=523701 RepID=A0A316G0I6_9GAMM|nr:RIP metalloprotease RseP [Pleionea mediterranea]PWK54318.1 site-2 protease [Pleionea mediterranea]